MDCAAHFLFPGPKAHALALVIGWFLLNRVDDQDIDGPFALVQFQTQTVSPALRESNDRPSPFGATSGGTLEPPAIVAQMNMV